MGIIFNVEGFQYLFGTLNTNLVKERYLLPNGFSATEGTLVYPPELFLIGRKTIILKNEKNGKDKAASLEFIVSKIGILRINLSVEIALEELDSIKSELFSINDTNFSLKNGSLAETAWKLLEHIFGKSSIEIQLNRDLNSDYFKKYCERYDIVPVGEMSVNSFQNYISITDKDNWEKIKNIESQKRKGGSILRNIVVIPNLDNSSISVDPAINILNSVDLIIYTNEFIIKDTINLIAGISYQRFGLNFLIYHLKLLKKKLLQIQIYYENPEKGRISWIYIDKALTKLENNFEVYVSKFELEFLDVEEPIYYNLNDVTFKGKMNAILEYNSAKKHYFEIKTHLEERFSSLRNKVSDKGEKEEKQAYNRIITIVGLLAIFQIVPSILPLFDQNLYVFSENIPISNLIRILFLLIFFPTLFVIWYATSYNNQKRVKVAEKIEHHENLLREKELFTNALTNFKNLPKREHFNISDNAFVTQIMLLDEKLIEIGKELKKIK